MYFCMKFGLTLFHYFKRVCILFDRRTNITIPYIIFYCTWYYKLKSKSFLTLVLKCWVDMSMYIKFASRKHIENTVSIKCRFGRVSFRSSSVVSVKCRFDHMSFRSSVVSIKCRLIKCRSIKCRVTVKGRAVEHEIEDVL